LVHTVNGHTQTTGSAQRPTAESAQALICVAGFELGGCRFIRGHSRVAASHPVARAFPEAFALPKDGRLRVRGRLRDLACKVRVARRERRHSEDAIWQEIEEMLAADSATAGSEL
jgi:hypothetical protein